MVSIVDQDIWNGYRRDCFLFEGKIAYVVKPNGDSNMKLAIKTEYWNAFPNAIEIPLLKSGFHLCFINNENRWGIDEDIERKVRFVRFVQKHYGLEQRSIPIGMSCGGLIAIKFAAAHPEMVSCLYLDAPVVNYMSCPCGFGIGQALNSTCDEILNALNLSSISELLAYREMPLDKLPQLIANRTPVALVAGDEDQVVPYCENGILIEKAYKRAGIPCEVYMKSGCDHHPHGLEDPSPVLNFILQYC